MVVSDRLDTHARTRAYARTHMKRKHNVKEYTASSRTQSSWLLNAEFSLSTSKRRIPGLQAQPHSFLTSTLDWGEWLTSCPGYLPSGKHSSTHWNEGLLGPRDGLDGLEYRKTLALVGIETRSPTRAVRSLVTIPTALGRFPFLIRTHCIMTKKPLNPISFVLRADTFRVAQ
jgi:hypothetical protein